MSEPTSATRRIVVIGGGISGLAAAHHALELNPSARVTLFEASNRLGGVIQTEHVGGYLLEQSADSFVTNVPAGIELCRRIGFESQLIETSRHGRRAFVVRGERLYPVPEGFTLMSPARFWPVARTPLLSWRGKLRLFAEAFIPRRKDDADESLASFARRRLGHEAYERLVQPLVGGIYTGDAEQLSLSATLPRFLEMEKQHGSLVRAALRQRFRKGEHATTASDSGARYGLFATPRAGLGSLIQALAACLPADAMRLHHRVERLSRDATGTWSVLARDAHGTASTQSFDGVIVAVAAPLAARLLATVMPDVADDLSAIPYAGSAIALCGYERQQIEHPLDGFGFVVPECEQRPILAGSFSSVKFADRAPPGRELLRVFLGGARRPDLVNQSDEQLREIVTRELATLLGVRGQPELFRVCRWGQAMPQYHLGHMALVDRIMARVSQQPGLALAGSAYRGVGIPHCVASGEAAAAAVASC